jgi:ribosomal peptide maturation radical SAM protein 1
MVQNLADQPLPSFESYFEDLSRRPSVTANLDVQIPMESSRGCWWGEKQHCTFCGLNGATIGFRSKPAEAVVDDVRAYAARYPGRKLCFVDNIMDRGFYGTLLPELAQLASGAEIFYEIKSNLTKGDVRALRDAGVRHIQPGIESLSDHVLGLMKKGVTAIQNLQLLKWCKEFGVRVDWNLLWGFPGETPTDYEAMARFFPWLVHLEPPARGSRIRLDRYSPNFQLASEFGFRRVRPCPSYGLVYDDLPTEAIQNLAYFFESDHDLDTTIDGYTLGVTDQIDHWHRTHAQSTLFHLMQDDRVVLLDSRPHLREREVRVLSPLASRLSTLCDSAQSVSALAQELPEAGPEQVRDELDAMCRQGVIWTDGRRFLSLAVSLSTYLESRRNARLDEGINRMLSEQRETV